MPPQRRSSRLNKSRSKPRESSSTPKPSSPQPTTDPIRNTDDHGEPANNIENESDVQPSDHTDDYPDIHSGGDDSMDTSPHTSHQAKRPRRRTAYNATGKKMNFILRTMQQRHISVDKFIEFILADTRHTPLIAEKQQQVFARMATSKTWQNQFISTIQSEFDALLGQKYFQAFDEDIDLDNLNFNDAYDSVLTVAPIWHKLITSLMKNTRADRPYYQKHLESQEKWYSKYLFSVTSIICHSRSKQNSNFFTRGIAIYLHGLGTKRRALEMLSGLGICASYRETLELFHRIRDKAKV
jgi:hypothetical protein